MFILKYLYISIFIKIMLFERSKLTLGRCEGVLMRVRSVTFPVLAWSKENVTLKQLFKSHLDKLGARDEVTKKTNLWLLRPELWYETATTFFFFNRKSQQRLLKVVKMKRAHVQVF